MVDNNVRGELLRNLGISKQALSQRAKTLKNKYGPMTTEEAVYVIAHVAGIDLSKHLVLEQLDRIRTLVPREIAPSPSTPSRTQTRSRSRPLARKETRAGTYPLVSISIVQRAIIIGQESYAQVVVLETSMRKLIKDRLTKQAVDWWKTLVPQEIQRNVQRTIDKEKKYPHRERRGVEPLMYCNFTDLKKIVLGKPEIFRDVLPDMSWFEKKMDDVYMARNSLAHSILLSPEDVSRIALFYKEWATLLEVAGIK